MTVPMNDRACWFGDGVYEAGMCRDGQIFALDEHVDRLFRSAEMLEIQVPVSKEHLTAIGIPNSAAVKFERQTLLEIRNRDVFTDGVWLENKIHDPQVKKVDWNLRNELLEKIIKKFGI